jgi:hypothetical protein
MGMLDLDAARAARAEAAGERHAIKFGGVVFELPVEIPADFAFYLVENDARSALRSLLGDRFDEFWALKPSIADLNELAGGVAKLYSFGDVGESVASVTSSKNGGKSSRRTSPATTRSTSAKPASATPRRNSGSAASVH